MVMQTPRTSKPEHASLVLDRIGHLLQVHELAATAAPGHADPVFASEVVAEHAETICREFRGLLRAIAAEREDLDALLQVAHDLLRPEAAVGAETIGRVTGMLREARERLAVGAESRDAQEVVR